MFATDDQCYITKHHCAQPSPVHSPKSIRPELSSTTQHIAIYIVLHIVFDLKKNQFLGTPCTIQFDINQEYPESTLCLHLMAVQFVQNTCVRGVIIRQRHLQFVT